MSASAAAGPIKKKPPAKASLLKEIGVSAPPVRPDPDLPLLPKVVKDDATEAWVDVAKLPIEHWEIQYKGNEPVGYTHRSVKTFESGQEDVLQLHAKSQTSFKSGNQSIEQEVEISTIERANGEVRKLDGSVKVGTQSRRFEGNIKDGYLNLISDTAPIAQSRRANTVDRSRPWPVCDRAILATLANAGGGETDVAVLRSDHGGIHRCRVAGFRLLRYPHLGWNEGATSGNSNHLPHARWRIEIANLGR